MAKAKDKQNVFDPGDDVVSLGELEMCREALLIGLASYGEMERLSAAQSGWGSDPDHEPSPRSSGSSTIPLCSIPRKRCLTSRWR